MKFRPNWYDNAALIKRRRLICCWSFFGNTPKRASRAQLISAGSNSWDPAKWERETWLLIIGRGDQIPRHRALKDGLSSNKKNSLPIEQLE